MAGGRDAALAAMAERDAVEAETRQILDALKIAMPGQERTGALVDQDGFPRADVDVYRIRLQRNRLAVLETDYNALTNQIQNFLHQALPPHHGTETVQTASNTTHNPPTSRSPAAIPSDDTRVQPDLDREVLNHPSVVLPFAKVDQIHPDSPAASSGLQLDDELLSFGSVSSAIYSSRQDAMQALAGVVRDNVNAPIPVRVMRKGANRPLGLDLVPRRWTGQGYLGCHISSL